MSLSLDEASDLFKRHGFLLIEHRVVIHHLRKDFTDYDVIRDRFLIKPIRKDFLHVALVQHEYGLEGEAVQIRYTCAGDDLLYGLRTKFTSGGAQNNMKDIDEILDLAASGNLRTHERYIRKRFRHGRSKAKLRALLVMVKEVWSTTFSFK